jgi:uncharacterized protein (DUF169 family)
MVPYEVELAHSENQGGNGRMADLDLYRGYGDELERQLRLKTFPLALKLLEKEGDIPDGAQRPLKDFGYHLSLCQAFQISRRDGMALAMLKEDNWCPEPVIGYGLGEPPKYFLEGHNRYPHDVETLEAGSDAGSRKPLRPAISPFGSRQVRRSGFGSPQGNQL